MSRMVTWSNGVASTPIQLAAEYCTTTMVRAMLSLGADATALSPDGCSVLHHVVRSDLGTVPKLEYLLNVHGDGYQGADTLDLSVVDGGGRTVEQLARELGKAEALKLIQNKVRELTQDPLVHTACWLSASTVTRTVPYGQS